MACEVCKVCVIGEQYSLHSGRCVNCDYRDYKDMLGTYLGLEGKDHVFAVDFRCSFCDAHINQYLVPCGDGGAVDVTEEFNIMFHKKESHWVGQSAKR